MLCHSRDCIAVLAELLEGTVDAVVSRPVGEHPADRGGRMVLVQLRVSHAGFWQHETGPSVA
jgi:hypothetical protein